jgi:hypothetical protein
LKSPMQIIGVDFVLAHSRNAVRNVGLCGHVGAEKALSQPTPGDTRPIQYLNPAVRVLGCGTRLV